MSSPGLDRELKKDREFAWAVGKEMRCWLREPLDGRREFSGRLVAVSGTELSWRSRTDGRREVPRALVTKARLDLAFVRPRRGSGSRAKQECMNNKDLIYVIEQIGREKGIGKEVLFEALESALLSASKKTMGLADNVRMEHRPSHRRLRVFARKKVVEAVTDPKLEISLDEARKLNGGGRARRRARAASCRRRSSGASRPRPPSR